MITGRPRSIITFLSVLLVGIFVLSLGTVEMHESKLCSWLKYPGFLEADSEKAIADTYEISIGVSEAADNYVRGPEQDVFPEQTTLFLHVYRGPPSLES
jgi:hypothetical protein